MGSDRSNGRRGNNDSRGRGGSSRGRGGGRGGTSYQFPTSTYSSSDYNSYNNMKPSNSINQNTGYGYSTQRIYGQNNLAQSYGGGDNYGSTYQYRGTTY